MDLRRVTLDDVDQIFALRLRGLQASPNAFLTTYEEESARGVDFFKRILSLPGDDNVIFAAFNEGTAIGSCGIVRSERKKTLHKAIIWGMYVDPEFRGQKLGAKLLDLANEHARTKMPVTAIYLSVEGENKLARRLYESRGFKFWGHEPRAMRFDGTYFTEDHLALLL